MARLEQILPAASAAASDASPNVGRRLAYLYDRARRTHPGLALDQDSFAAHLARCGADLDTTCDGGEDSDHAGDLFLAAAALAAEPDAVLELTRRCWPAALRCVRRLTGSASELDDIGQELWKSLLVATDHGPPKLASYSGRGPLAAFVAIAAYRIGLMRFRHLDLSARAVRAAAEIETLTLDPELAIMKERYRASFQEAVGEALNALDDRTRTVLRMHVVDRVSLERIAQAYGVRQSTVSRWLNKARKQVARDTRRCLKARIQLSESDFDSICKLMISQLDMSVSRLLRAG